MTEQLTLAVDTPQLTWQPPDTRAGCNRDPAAGPGSCAHWWGGCDKAEKRGCYRRWATSDAILAHWSALAPEAWATAPEALAPLTAGHLRDQCLIEIRMPEGERWQWRRRPARQEEAA